MACSARLEAERVPASAVVCTRRIWLPRNYIVKRRQDRADGTYTYWMEQWENVIVPSGA